MVTPLRVAFFDESTPGWVALESVINFIFFIDMILSFISAYYNRKEVLVLNRRRIACKYLKGWFLIDLISILPLQLVTGSMINQFGKMARLLRVQKLLRTAK